VLQHTLFTRAHPTPEQLSTLLARLGALMGQDRVGAPAVIDTYRPGAFAMAAFKTDHESNPRERMVRQAHPERPLILSLSKDANSADSAVTRDLVSALRRCRHPVPARVVIAEGRPVRVTTDRRGFAGGAVTRCAGPWRTSGEWWAGGAGQAGRAGRENPDQTVPPILPLVPVQPWNRDEWDVALNDGAVYRIFQDRVTDAWFIDAMVD
jgi:protein ImuB